MITNRILVTIFLIISAYSFQQKLDSDSLIARVRALDDQKLKVDEINQFAHSIVWVFPDSALALVENAQLISDQIGYNEGLAKALQINSSANYILGKTDLALKSGLESIKFAKISGNSDLISDCANNLGLIYQDLKDYQTSIEYFKEAIEAPQINRQNSHSIINNMANSYYYLEDYEKSLLYHEEAMNIRIEANNMSGIADCLNDIGLVNFEMGETDLAIRNIKRCMFIKDSIGDVEGIAFSSLDLAGIYLRLEDYKNMRYYAQKGLDAAVVISSKKYKQYATTA